MDVLFLMSIFRLYPGLKLSFEHKSVRKIPFLNAFLCCCFRLYLRHMDPDFDFGGAVGCGESYLEFSFAFSKFLDYK